MRWVVVDLEATCWTPDQHAALAADQRNECEIIEIGAVRMTLDSVPQVTDPPETFQTRVRPRRHPILSPFCMELTGIGQRDVDEAPWFPEAYRAFVEWAGDEDGLIVASWGAWDDRQLRRDAERWALPEPRWKALNIKRLFARRARIDVPRHGGWMGLSAAMEHLDMTFGGRRHSALDDALNAARVLGRIGTTTE